MTTKTIPVREFVAQHYQNVCALCKIGSTIIYSATHRKQYWLFMVGAPVNMATICEYKDWREWQTEMAVLRRAAMGGGEGESPDMGMTANLPPSPLTLPVSNTHALPVADEAGLLA